MKQIILTAVDNNDHFWFDQLVPFLLSLKQTNYQGDISVIAYDLSEIKKQVLLQQGIIIIEAPHQYQTIFIDRQWAAASIAAQLDYDYIALYDTDIWFPNKDFTLFLEIKQQDKLYCVSDHVYGYFIEECVKPEYRKHIQKLMQNHYLEQYQTPWQVGVIVGAKQAWLEYKQYITQKLAQTDIFTQEYGIDTLLICLYALEKQSIAKLPIKYNCIPSNGHLLHSNISPQGEILSNPIFTTASGELLQGIHIVGPFRIYERNFYEYANHHGVHYFNAGNQYRLKQLSFTQKAVEPFKINLGKNQLKLIKIVSETDVELNHEQNDVLLTVGAKTHIYLINNEDQPINLKFAVQLAFGHKLTKGRFVAYQEKAPSITEINQWQGVVLAPNEQIILACYDVDTDAKMIWRLNNVSLI